MAIFNFADHLTSGFDEDALATVTATLALSVLMGLGARWSASARINDLETTNAALQVENASYRAATRELAEQISTLQTAVDQLGERATVDPGARRAMDKLPAAIKSRAMGGMTGLSSASRAAFTPFVEAGAGWTDVDSNIPSGPPTTGCWWDPWWGYICSSFYETYSETRTSYLYGVGVRWEMGSDMVLKGTYSLMNVDTNAATKDFEQDVLRFDLLWRF